MVQRQKNLIVENLGLNREVRTGRYAIASEFYAYFKSRWVGEVITVGAGDQKQNTISKEITTKDKETFVD